MNTKDNIELSTEQQNVVQLAINTQQNILLTGLAGSGKTLTTKKLLEVTPKKVMVTATTGVAALNLGGVTLHHALGFKPDITLDTVADAVKNNNRKANIIKALDTLVIDESSMLRADLADCVELALRLYRDSQEPWGGVQIILIGDLYQLPPVLQARDKAVFYSVYESEYFFSSQAYKTGKFKLIELTTVYRQKDTTFVDNLNKLRDGNISDKELLYFNNRVNKSFEPAKDEMYVCLTATNNEASRINDIHLASIISKPYLSEAVVNGDFPSSYYPTELALTLKVGAQVMMITNDKGGRYINGSLGVIRNIKRPDAIIQVELQTGMTIEVTRNTWEIMKLVSTGDNRLKNEVIGSFTQHPMRLAAAITIHKSQGQSIPNLIIDTKNFFASGQLYVALSRAMSIEGLVLKNKIYRSDIKVDYRITKFMKGLTGNSNSKENIMHSLRSALSSGRK